MEYRRASARTLTTTVHRTLLIVDSETKLAALTKRVSAAFDCLHTGGGPVSHLSSFQHARVVDGSPPRVSVMWTPKDPVVHQVRKAVREAGRVVFVTDGTPESEAAAWSVCEACKLDPLCVARWDVREWSAEAIQRVLRAPDAHGLDPRLVHSARAKTVLDLWAGYAMSAALGPTPGVTVGRAAWSALCALHAVDRPASSSVPGKGRGEAFLTHHRLVFGSDDVSDADLFAEREDKWVVEVEPVQRVETPAPNAATWRDVLEAGLASPADVVAAATELYRDGWITWPWTTDARLPAAWTAEAVKHVRALAGDAAVPAAAASGSLRASTDDVVPGAVRPTHVAAPECRGQSPVARKVYAFVYQRALAACMAPWVGRSIRATATSPSGRVVLEHRSGVHTVLSGWRRAEFGLAVSERNIVRQLNEHSTLHAVSTYSLAVGPLHAFPSLVRWRPVAPSGAPTTPWNAWVAAIDGKPSTQCRTADELVSAGWAIVDDESANASSTTTTGRAWTRHDQFVDWRPDADADDTRVNRRTVRITDLGRMRWSTLRAHGWPEHDPAWMHTLLDDIARGNLSFEQALLDTWRAWPMAQVPSVKRSSF